MGYTEWNKVAVKKSGGQINFLKLVGGNKYIIRPILKPVSFHKYFYKNDGKLRTAICGDPNVCPVAAKHPELERPSERYAIYVIDRGDAQVKIMEAPVSVFRCFRKRYEDTGVNPSSGKDGGNWSIEVTGVGFAKRYEASYIDKAPLTESEIEAIKQELGGDKDKLLTVYKSDSPEEIEKKLFAEIPDEKTSAQTPVESTPVESTPVESTPVESTDDNEGDDFNMNWL